MSWYSLKLVLRIKPGDYQPVFVKLLSRIKCLNYRLHVGCHLKQILITLLFYDVVNHRRPRQFLLFFPNVWHIQPPFQILIHKNTRNIFINFAKYLCWSFYAKIYPKTRFFLSSASTLLNFLMNGSSNVA